VVPPPRRPPRRQWYRFLCTQARRSPHRTIASVDLPETGRSSGRLGTTISKPHNGGQEAVGVPIGDDGAGFRPSFPLVDAKLRKPVLRPWIVRRDRLVRVLTAEPWASVASVVAPPGYGKTILLADWASRERRPVTWLTIDDYDNEPSVFLTYLAVALDRLAPIDPAVGRALGSSHSDVRTRAPAHERAARYPSP